MEIQKSHSRKFKFSLADLKFGGENAVLSSKRLTVLYATLFVVWVVVTALAVSRGSRFITTIVLPFAFLAGIFVGYACDYIKNRLKNDNWITVAVLLCAFLAAVPLATINTIYGIALFAVIAAIGLASIYALKDNSADKKHVPIKKSAEHSRPQTVLFRVHRTTCGTQWNGLETPRTTIQ